MDKTVFLIATGEFLLAVAVIIAQRICYRNTIRVKDHSIIRHISEHGATYHFNELFNYHLSIINVAL